MPEHIIFYYIDVSLGIKLLVKFIRNYIRDRIFHILTGEDFDDVISRTACISAPFKEIEVSISK